jgi:hypothetical protein
MSLAAILVFVTAVELATPVSAARHPAEPPECLMLNTIKERADRKKVQLDQVVEGNALQRLLKNMGVIDEDADRIALGALFVKGGTTVFAGFAPDGCLTGFLTFETRYKGSLLGDDGSI